jgi:RNase H-like domain found in reverse transcriptase
VAIQLKAAVTAALVLRVADSEADFVLHTDASDHAIGRASSQVWEGVAHPVAFNVTPADYYGDTLACS